MQDINTFTDDIKLQEMFNELNDYVIESDDEEYPHLTFKVSSVIDYLKVVNLLAESKDKDYSGEEIIYRGMSSKGWKLMPALGRCQDLSNSQEYNMVNNFIVLRPEEFQNLNTNFEILSKMQHFGLPTRLLDFTLNPLIALFFACNELIGEEDARIVSHRAYLKLSKDPIIEEICGFYNYFVQEDVRIEDLKVLPYKYLYTLYRVRDYRLLVARPYNWNDRIRRQAAVFMIFPNKLSDYFGMFVSGGRINYPHHWENEEISASLEMVEREPLKKMFPNSYVRAFGFEARDFSVTHESIKCLFDYYSENSERKCILNEWREPLKGRFQFDCALQSIDLETMKNDFCSIIIDKDKKKDIIKELGTLGIDEAYVYPELQYTAKKIKDTYFDV